MENDPDFLGQLKFELLTKNNWDKFVELFGPNGACANCWCMYYRLLSPDYKASLKNGLNKDAMQKLVWESKPTGILAMYNNKAVAWCAFSPREDFVRIEKSKVLKHIDNRPVWSIPCFFIHKEFRKNGVSGAVLNAVIGYARNHKIGIIEAYPVVASEAKVTDTSAWPGFLNTYTRAGFVIAGEKSKNKPIVRFYLETSG